MVKTITVTEEAYTHLKEHTQGEESFSELIERFFHKKERYSLMKLQEFCQMNKVRN